MLDKINNSLKKSTDIDDKTSFQEIKMEYDA